MTRLPLTTSPSSPLNFPRCSSASLLSSNNKCKKFTSTDIDWSARQRAGCHLSASKWTRATERVAKRSIYSQRLDIQLEKWRQASNRSTASLLSSDYNYNYKYLQQASLTPPAQASNQDYARLDKRARLRMINTCSSNTWWWLTLWPISSQLLDLKVQQDCIWFQ